MSTGKLIQRIFLVALLLTSAWTAVSQIRIASPYSRFGIGDISDKNNCWNLSMGQVSFAIRSPYHINYSNPASYSAFDSSSFVFEGGFNSEFVTLTSSFQTVDRNYASLGYLLFGMPVTRWWRISLGLVPYSDVGFNVVNYEEYTSVGTVIRLYTGAGGINRFYWGNSFRIVKNLSIGFNANYLFGRMSREATVLFPDSIHSSNFKVINDITMNDVNIDIGIQYRFRLKKDFYMTVAGVFANSNLMHAQTDLLAYTFLMGASGIEYPRDTIAKAEGYPGDIVIPLMFGGGVCFEQADKFMVGVDYKWQNWKQFKAFGEGDSLLNSWEISAGAEIVPNINNYTNYFSRVRYRVGFFYNQTYLQLRGKQLAEYAFTLGFGFPLRGIKTALNVGAQVGVRGTTELNLIRESYFKFTLGFSIYERWFIKRKYY